jgi:hypothetical protein
MNPSLCQNNGLCYPDYDNNDYNCVCHGTKGRNCEICKCFSNVQRHQYFYIIPCVIETIFNVFTSLCHCKLNSSLASIQLKVWLRWRDARKTRRGKRTYRARIEGLVVKIMQMLLRSYRNHRVFFLCRSENSSANPIASRKASLLKYLYFQTAVTTASSLLQAGPLHYASVSR